MAISSVAIVADLVDASREHERAGDIGRALHWAMEALDLARQAGDDDGEAAACVALSMAHVRLGHYPTAKGLLEQALARANPHSPERAEALLVLGICAGETDDLPGAETYFREAIDLSRQVGADTVLIRGLHGLSAGIYVPHGEFELALATDAEALKLAQDRDLQILAWRPVLMMSWVYWLTGRREHADSMLDELRCRAQPGSLGEGYWYFIRAGLAMEDGAFDEARELLTAFRSLAEANGIVELGFFVRLGMSRLARATGDAPSALAWAVDAMALVERTGYRHLQGMALIERGRAHWALDRVVEAEADLRAACAVLVSLNARFDLARSQLLLAALLRAVDSPEAETAWVEAATGIVGGGYAFLLEQERALAFPLVAAYLDAAQPGVRVVSAGLLVRLAQVPPPPLRIVTLGGFEVQQGGRRIPERTWAVRRAGELFRLLMISPGRQLTREQTIEALWPGNEASTAVPQLHQATSALRHALEPDLPSRFPSRYLLFEGGVVGLRLPRESWIDYEAFTALLQQEHLEEAVSLWRGELFPGDRYADWAVRLREDLRARYLRALLALARQCSQGGDAEATLALCRRLLDEEPWYEDAVLLGMHACIALGDRVGALRLYRALEEALREELDIEPPVMLHTLYESLA